MGLQAVLFGLDILTMHLPMVVKKKKIGNMTLRMINVPTVTTVP